MDEPRKIGEITVIRTEREVIPVLDTDFSDFNWMEEEPTYEDMAKVAAYRRGVREEYDDYEFERDA